MGYKKTLIKELKKALDWQYTKGYDEGSVSAFDEGWQAGWDARFENVKARLNGLFDAHMSSRRFKEAQMVTEIIEYLNFFIEPFDAEKYQEELEKDGF